METVIDVHGDAVSEGVRAKARPGIRFWARAFDFALFKLVIIPLIHLPLLKLLFSLPKMPHFIVQGVLYTALYMVLDGLILWRMGTTPGKALFRLVIRREDDSELSEQDLIHRNIQIWLRGLGLGIPFFLPVTLFAAYNDLIRRGNTRWDEDLNLSVEHEEWSDAQRLQAIVISVLVFFLAIKLPGLFQY